MNSKQFTFIELFEDKGQSIREVLFSILPAMIGKFIEEDLEMDLSNNQWDIIEKVQKWGENNT